MLLGGDSEERDVSLSSGCAVTAALRAAGHDVLAVDTLTGPLDQAGEARILESGVQALPPDTGADLFRTGDTSALTLGTPVEKAEVFFLALHGGAGEGGAIQAMLDLMGKTYTGSGMAGSAVAMDKDISKRLMRDAGILTPAWLAGMHDEDRVVEQLGLPVVVKAARGGSSLRLLLARDMEELREANSIARGFDDLVVYERYVRGRELTVGVLGEETLPVGEIIPEHELFDYECKYQPGMAEEVFPADLGERSARYLQDLAMQVHRLLRLRDFSRVDFIFDEEGRAWCLEANALPGLTANSLLPKAARAAGISFPELCDRIVKLAIERHQIVAHGPATSPGP